MKKFLMIMFSFALLLIFNGADAQIYKLRTNAGALFDTVTNTGTVTMTARVPGDGTGISVQVNTEKVDGTPAGTAKLYGTVDGSNYVQIATDTLAVQNVANGSKIWVISGHPYTSYRVVVTGTGTSNYIVTGEVLRRLK